MVMDADEKISPLTFPIPSVSPEYVNIMASGLRSVGESVSETGGSITGAWAGLSECYTAPESETLHAVLDPVATDGEEVAGGMADAATALEAFAEDVQSIKNSWSALTTKAHDLLRRIEAEGEDWRKSEGWGNDDNELVAENKLLIKEGQDLVNEYAEYEITCANAISKGIPGRTVFEETPEGGGDLDPNVFYHGYEQDLSELATEWGMSGASADHPWWIDAGDAVWDFGVGAVEGTGAMLGLHSSEGWFAQSWGDSIKEYHWDNITSAAALVGMYDAESDSLGWTGGEGVKEAWKDLAHSVVPWEEWGDRPWYVIGTAALNIGAMVGGAVLTATGVGSVVGVPLMAWRGAAILDGMGSSGRGGSGMDVDLPNLPDTPRLGDSGAPMVPIDLSKLDTSGFSPEQMNEIRASLDRIAAEHPTGNDASAGGRPSQPRGDQSDPQRGQQRPASAGEAHPDGARAGDLELFDRLISTPENQQFAQQVSQNHAGEAASVDRAAKTNPRGSSGSDEGRWTISELGGDPRTRELATTAPRHDSDSAHAQSSGPSSDQHLRQNDIEGQSSDANRSGERDSSANTPNDRSGDGPQARDRGPTASNSSGGSTPNSNNSSPDTPAAPRASDESFGRSVHSAPDTAVSHREVDGQPMSRDRANDSLRPKDGSDGDTSTQRGEDSDPITQEREPIDSALDKSESQENGAGEENANNGDVENLGGDSLERDGRPFAEKHGLDTLGGKFDESSKPIPTLSRSDLPDALRKGRILGLIPDEMVAARNQKGEITHIVTLEGRTVLLEQWQKDLNTARTEEIRKYREEHLERGKDRKMRPMISERDMGRKVGAVNAILVDLINGVVAEGMNGPPGSILGPTEMHPKLQARIDEMTVTGERSKRENVEQYQMHDKGKKPIPPPEGLSETPHHDKPGRHAEIKAASAILHYLDTLALENPNANIKSEISQLQADNRYTFKKDDSEKISEGGKEDDKTSFDCPFCANCSTILHDAPDPLAGRMTHEKNHPDLVEPRYRELPPVEEQGNISNEEN